MKPPRKCRVVRAFGGYRKGDIIEPLGGVQRDLLIRQGLIELITEQTIDLKTDKPAQGKRKRERVK